MTTSTPPLDGSLIPFDPEPVDGTRVFEDELRLVSIFGLQFKLAMLRPGRRGDGTRHRRCARRPGRALLPHGRAAPGPRSARPQPGRGAGAAVLPCPRPLARRAPRRPGTAPDGLNCVSCQAQHGLSTQYRNLLNRNAFNCKNLTCAVTTNDAARDVYERSAGAYGEADVDIGQNATYISSLSQFNSHTNRVKATDSQGLWNGSAGDKTDIPSCFGCHKAHGTKNTFGLIFMAGSGPVTEDGDGGIYKDLCRRCHVEGGQTRAGNPAGRTLQRAPAPSRRGGCSSPGWRSEPRAGLAGETRHG